MSAPARRDGRLSLCACPSPLRALLLRYTIPRELVAFEAGRLPGTSKVAPVRQQMVAKEIDPTGP